MNAKVCKIVLNELRSTFDKYKVRSCQGISKSTNIMLEHVEAAVEMLLIRGKVSCFAHAHEQCHFVIWVSLLSPEQLNQYITAKTQEAVTTAEEDDDQDFDLGLPDFDSDKN